MGNSSSSSSRAHHDDSVDYGSLTPMGVYTGQRDWNQNIVSQLIVGRKLAPFYRPLEDYEENWDDDQILAARKDLNDSEHPDNPARAEVASVAPSHSSSTKSKRTNSLKEPIRPEAQIYRGAVECPICFLYYPPNINHSRCCDQAICTECFVQIKRSEPTTTHVVSEPAACPYCVQDNFGVVYTPPPWRAGLGSEGYNAIWSDRSTPESNTPPTHRRRQKSFGADSPEVVTTDQIRPDWEAKLEAVRAAVARRANRRIIMRQVGDRLIPVGVTSGRVHALSPEEAAAAAAAVENASSGRRSRRRRGDQPGAFEQFIGMGGQDLEELMLMEAMRLSLLEHEEQQRKEAEEKKKQEAEKAAGGDSSADSAPSNETSSLNSTPSAIPGPGPSTLEARSTSNLTSSSASNLSVQGATSTSVPRSSSPSPHRHTTSVSNSTPSQPAHVTSLSQDSLTTNASGSRSSSWSLSRSRTPPPPPPNPVTAVGVPMNEGNDASWRARANSPPSISKSKSALSTLSAAAALASTSVGAAVLGGSRGTSREGSRSTTPEPTQSTSGHEGSTQPPTHVQDASDTGLAPAIPSVMTPGTAVLPMITVVHNDGDATPLTDELAAAMSEDVSTPEENPFLAPGEVANGDGVVDSGSSTEHVLPPTKNPVQDGSDKVKGA